MDRWNIIMVSLKPLSPKHMPHSEVKRPFTLHWMNAPLTSYGHIWQGFRKCWRKHIFWPLQSPKGIFSKRDWKIDIEGSIIIRWPFVWKSGPTPDDDWSLMFYVLWSFFRKIPFGDCSRQKCAYVSIFGYLNYRWRHCDVTWRHSVEYWIFWF